jgi:hypothetical protein
VNTNKTKVVIVSKKKVRLNQSFKIKGQNIEIIDSYYYLGMLFNYNGNFCTARKKITEQARQALFAVYRKIRNISIPVDLQLFKECSYKIVNVPFQLIPYFQNAILQKRTIELN